MFGFLLLMVLGFAASGAPIMNEMAVDHLVYEFFQGEGCLAENRIGISAYEVASFSSSNNIKWNSTTQCIEQDGINPRTPYYKHSIGFVCNETEPNFYYQSFSSMNCEGEADYTQKTSIGGDMVCRKITNRDKITSQIVRCHGSDVNQSYAHIVYYRDSKCTRNIVNRMKDMYVKLDTCFRFPKSSGNDNYFILHKEDDGNVTYTVFDDGDCTNELTNLRRGLMKGKCQIEKNSNSTTTRRSIDDEGSIEYLGLGVSEVEDESYDVTEDPEENEGKTVFYSLALLGVVLALLF